MPLATERRAITHASATASQQAMLYGAAGRLDTAFVCLDEAMTARDPAMVYLAVGPQWDALRGDARFADRLRAVALLPVEP